MKVGEDCEGDEGVGDRWLDAKAEEGGKEENVPLPGWGAMGFVFVVCHGLG